MVHTIRDELRNRVSHGYRFMVDYPQGWDGIVEELHNKLIEIVPDYTVFQVKEKFGGLRFYTAELGGGEPEWEEAHRLIREAESKSYEVCQDCGQPGNLHHDGWSRTLCDRCRAERLGIELDRWEGEGGLATED